MKRSGPELSFILFSVFTTIEVFFSIKSWRFIPPTWTYECDEDLVHFLYDHIGKEDENLGSVKQCVNSIDVSSFTVSHTPNIHVFKDFPIRIIILDIKKEKHLTSNIWYFLTGWSPWWCELPDRREYWDLLGKWWDAGTALDPSSHEERHCGQVSCWAVNKVMTK